MNAVLNPWDGKGLLGIDGTPLQVGYVQVEVSLEQDVLDKSTIKKKTCSKNFSNWKSCA